MSLHDFFSLFIFKSGHNEDFSSNALTDGLEKYSRFHSKNEFSVWCSSPNAKLNKGIRELVYQINPNNILCVYKKLFETCALNNLRVVDHGEDESTRYYMGLVARKPVFGVSDKARLKPV